MPPFDKSRGGMSRKDNRAKQQERYLYAQENGLAVRTHQEIAAIMTERGHKMSTQAVQQTEARGLYKIWKLLRGKEKLL